MSQLNLKRRLSQWDKRLSIFLLGQNLEALNALFEPVRDRITSDSEDNALVAGGGKAGEERGEGAICRVSVGCRQSKPDTALSSRSSEFTGEIGHRHVSIHVIKPCLLLSDGSQGNEVFIFSSAN